MHFRLDSKRTAFVQAQNPSSDQSVQGVRQEEADLLAREFSSKQDLHISRDDISMYDAGGIQRRGVTGGHREIWLRSGSNTEGGAEKAMPELLQHVGGNSHHVSTPRANRSYPLTGVRDYAATLASESPSPPGPAHGVLQSSAEDVRGATPLTSSRQA
eukprot:1679376-Amphidinium_carterae.1